MRSVADLRGRTIAIPSRFSDERLIWCRALKENGISRVRRQDGRDAAARRRRRARRQGRSTPSRWASRSPSQAEIGGYGRVLFQAQEYWPDYMSCVLVVRQDVDRQPPARGAGAGGRHRALRPLARPGQPNREHAADFVGRYYYNQPPALLRWALTTPLDRVMYSPLTPRKPDFDLVRDLMIETGVLDRKIAFEEYVDMRFADGSRMETPWRYEPGSSTAE